MTGDQAGAIDHLPTFYLPADGTSLAIERVSGRIAVGFGRNVWILKPGDQQQQEHNAKHKESRPRWIELACLRLDSTCNSLSWSSPTELMSGSESLILWEIRDSDTYSTYANNNNDDGLVDGFGENGARVPVDSTDSASIVSFPGDVTFTAIVQPRKIWQKKLANEIMYVEFSPNSELVASVGKYDKLVKLWRRSSFDVDSISFDFEYLPHPATLKSLRWQEPRYGDETINNVLYTCCHDHKVRVWTMGDASEQYEFQLRAAVDIGAGSCPFFLDSSATTVAVEGTIFTQRNEKNEPNDQSERNKSYREGKLRRSKSLSVGTGIDTSGGDDDLQRLINLGTTEPDLIFALNIESRTVAVWALDVGTVTSVTQVVKPTQFSVAGDQSGIFKRTKLRGYVRRPSFVQSGTSVASVLSGFAYPTSSRDPFINILIHGQHCGAIGLFQIEFIRLMSSAMRTKLLSLEKYFTGHSKSVQKISRSTDGTCLFTQSRFADNGLWKPWVLPTGVILRKTCAITTRLAPVRRAALGKEGEFAVTLLVTGLLVAWDCRDTENAIDIAQYDTKIDVDPLCMFLLPEENLDHVHLIIVYPGNDVRAYGVYSGRREIKFLGEFPLPVSSNGASTRGNPSIRLAVPVDPMGWSATVGDRLDTFQRSVLVTVSDDGQLTSWTARVVTDDDKDHAHTIEWLQLSVVDTDEKDILRAAVSSTKKIAISCQGGRKLAIWDTEIGVLEYEETFDDQEDSVIADIDWTTSPGNQSVLGLGFQKQVMLYCQLRYDYTRDRPSWAPFRRVDISQYTDHSIGDSIWLKNGTFVVGVGNQLILQDEQIDVNDHTTRQLLESRYMAQAVENRTIFDVCAVMNGPLPLYHPQLLIQLVFADKIAAVRRIIARFTEKLRYATILEPLSIADIDTMLGYDSDKEEDDTGKKKSFFAELEYLMNPVRQPSDPYIDEETFNELVSKLQKISLPYLTRHQQMTLVTVIEALAQIRSHIQLLDANGVKFLLGHKLFKMHRGTQPSMTFRDFSWALHSDCKEVLLEKVMATTPTPGSPLPWTVARDVGIAFWLTESLLRTQMEAIARTTYAQTRDPVECSLFYLALKKKQVLLGLWKVSSGHKEQAKTLKLLSNDFNEPRYKSVAMKNAYALLGKHRYHYAAALFLLADRVADAVDVLVKYVQDISLAVAVVRLYCGDRSPEMRRLLDKHVVPYCNYSEDEDNTNDGSTSVSTKKFDRWTLSWSHWIVGEYEMAMQVLAGSESSTGSTNSWYLAEDCAYYVLYRYLRDRLRMRSSKSEFRFVLRTAAIYSRMGCDVLALDLTRTWEFKGIADIKEEIGTATPAMTKVASAATMTTEETASATSSNPLSPSPTPSSNAPPEELSEKAASKPPQYTFEEPDMSAFSFGF